MWAISAGLCPIGSLLLLMFAPHSPGSNPQWFAVFVGTVGIAFGLCSAVLITRLVAKPVDELRTAFHAVGQGQLDVQIPLRRADEFGALVGEFTARAAQADPKTIVNFLNRFLQAMVEIVETEHGGMVNKFLGDGFMAV